MPDSRTVEVHFDTLAVNPVRNCNHFILGDDCAIEGVFQRHNLCGCTFMRLRELISQQGIVKKHTNGYQYQG